MKIKKVRKDSSTSLRIIKITTQILIKNYKNKKQLKKIVKKPKRKWKETHSQQTKLISHKQIKIFSLC